MTRIQKRKQMYAMIESYQSGDLTQKEFCLKNGINYSTFRFWLHQYRQEEGNASKEQDNPFASGDFVPINISPSAEHLDRETAGFQCRIEYPCGTRISFGTVPETAIIRELLSFQVT